MKTSSDCSGVQQYMRPTNGASITLNASIVASKGFAANSVYSATKAAVRSFARTVKFKSLTTQPTEGSNRSAAALRSNRSDCRVADL